MSGLDAGLQAITINVESSNKGCTLLHCCEGTTVF